MNWEKAQSLVRGAGRSLWMAAALAMAGCAGGAAVNPFAAGGINPDSSVAAEVTAASRSPGPYPRFSQVPAVPTDVRPVPVWRNAVIGEWADKRQTEREAAALAFTLGGTEAWAESMRGRIPRDELSRPTPNATDQSEAFAAAERARATPPPPPQ
jgi:hypothetical protein